MKNTNFDTNRFVENSSSTQIENGTIQFMDTENPGVYYTAHRNGNVNRVFKTQEVNITNDNSATVSNIEARLVIQELIIDLRTTEVM